MLKQPTQNKKRPLDELSNRRIFERDFDIIKQPPKQDLFQSVVTQVAALIPTIPIAAQSQPQPQPQPQPQLQQRPSYEYTRLPRLTLQSYQQQKEQHKAKSEQLKQAIVLLERTLAQEHPQPDKTIFYPNLVTPLYTQNNSTNNSGFLSPSTHWSYRDDTLTLNQKQVLVPNLLCVFQVKSHIYVSTRTQLNQYDMQTLSLTNQFIYQQGQYCQCSIVHHNKVYLGLGQLTELQTTAACRSNKLKVKAAWFDFKWLLGADKHIEFAKKLEDLKLIVACVQGVEIQVYDWDVRLLGKIPLSKLPKGVIVSIEGIHKRTLVLIMSTGVRVHIAITESVDYEVTLVEPSPVEAVLTLSEPTFVQLTFERNYLNPKFNVIKYMQVRREIEVFCVFAGRLLAVVVQHFQQPVITITQIEGKQVHDVQIDREIQILTDTGLYKLRILSLKERLSQDLALFEYEFVSREYAIQMLYELASEGHTEANRRLTQVLMDEGIEIVLKQQNIVIANIIEYAMHKKINDLSPDLLSELSNKLSGVLKVVSAMRRPQDLLKLMLTQITQGIQLFLSIQHAMSYDLTSLPPLDVTLFQFISENVANSQVCMFIEQYLWVKQAQINTFLPEEYLKLHRAKVQLTAAKTEQEFNVALNQVCLLISNTDVEATSLLLMNKVQTFGLAPVLIYLQRYADVVFLDPVNKTKQLDVYTMLIELLEECIFKRAKTTPNESYFQSINYFRQFASEAYIMQIIEFITECLDKKVHEMMIKVLVDNKCTEELRRCNSKHLSQYLKDDSTNYEIVANNMIRLHQYKECSEYLLQAVQEAQMGLSLRQSLLRKANLCLEMLGQECEHELRVLLQHQALVLCAIPDSQENRFWIDYLENDICTVKQLVECCRQLGLYSEWLQVGFRESLDGIEEVWTGIIKSNADFTSLVRRVGEELFPREHVLKEMLLHGNSQFQMFGLQELVEAVMVSENEYAWLQLSEVLQGKVSANHKLTLSRFLAWLQAKDDLLFSTSQVKVKNEMVQVISQMLY